MKKEKNQETSEGGGEKKNTGSIHSLPNVAFPYGLYPC